MSPNIGRQLAGLEITAGDQRRIAELQVKLRRLNLKNPGLRLRAPDLPHLGGDPDLKLCVRYHNKYRKLLNQDDAMVNVGKLLLEFLEKHEREWDYCGWTNDAVAELLLGKLGRGTTKIRREVALQWLKRFWRRETQFDRNLQNDLSPTRMAASKAAYELEMLDVLDESGLYKRFAMYLNNQWPKLSVRKKGKALFDALIRQFRLDRPMVHLDDMVLDEICCAYGQIESHYKTGALPPSAVLQTVMARRYGVSARTLAKVRTANRRGLPFGNPRTTNTAERLTKKHASY